MKAGCDLARTHFPGRGASQQTLSVAALRRSSKQPSLQLQLQGRSFTTPPCGWCGGAGALAGGGRLCGAGSLRRRPFGGALEPYGAVRVTGAWPAATKCIRGPFLFATVQGMLRRLLKAGKASPSVLASAERAEVAYP